MKFIQDVCGSLYNVDMISCFAYEYISVDDDTYIDILLTLEKNNRPTIVAEYNLQGEDPDLLIVGFFHKIMSCPFEVISQKFIEVVLNQLSQHETL